MIGSQTAEYALRVLAFMSMDSSNEPMRAHDLSRQLGIPSPYLSKIMRRLVEAGLLDSRKGHGGGFVFARPLSEIRFADILEAVDQEAPPQGCVFGWQTCDEDRPCPLHPFWKSLRDDFESWACAHSLEEVREHGTDLHTSFPDASSAGSA